MRTVACNRRTPSRPEFRSRTVNIRVPDSALAFLFVKFLLVSTNGAIIY